MTVSCNYREQLCVDSAPGPGTIVIFGASGDLTKRKLLPAIHALFERKLLPEKFAVIGVARTEMTNEAFQEEVREAMAANGDTVTDDSWPDFPMWPVNIRKRLCLNCLKPS